MTAPAIVYAVHNFEAENEDEINFQIGEPIIVLERDEKYLDGWWQGRNTNGDIGLFPMNYTSTEKPLQSQQDGYMPSPHLSSHSSTSGSTIEEEIDDAISQIKLSNNYPTPPPPVTNSTSSTPTPKHHQETIHSFLPPPPSAPLPTDTILSPSASSDINSTPAMKPELWDVEQVAEWLTSVGLENVTFNFIDQEITGDILLDLNIDTLKELGINTFGKRYKIMQAIASLKESLASAPVVLSPSNSHVISRPTSRRSLAESLQQQQQQPQRPVSNTSSSNNSSNSDGTGLYQFPRKAPLPPATEHLSPHPPPPIPTSSSDLRPLSPQSLNSSSNISRSNTFNTISSNGSTTMRSRDLSPDPPSGFRSPRRMLSQKSQNTMESNEPMKNDHPEHPMGPPPPSNHLAPSQLPTSSNNTNNNVHKLSVSSVSSFEGVRGSTAEPFQAPEHEGWLHKQGDKYKTWNKRWFVLKGSNLFYFKSPKDVRMKGIINLRGYKIIVDESIHAGKYCFKAQHDRERTFYFYTETEESMRTWLKMLLKTTIARDFKAPVMSSNHIATVSLDVARKMRPRPPSVIMYNQQHQTAIVQPNVIMEEEETAPLPDFLRNDTINEDEDLIDPQHRSLPPLDQQSVTSSISDYAPNQRAHEYLDWVNSYMRQGRKVNDLTTAFRNGETLINLLEAISNKEVRRPPPQKGGAVSVMMLDNIVAAFKFMGRDGVQVDGQYTIKDVFGGNEEKIMAMLDAIKDWSQQYTKKPSPDAVLIDKNSGWRGSAMMDHRSYSDDDY